MLPDCLVNEPAGALWEEGSRWLTPPLALTPCIPVVRAAEQADGQEVNARTRQRGARASRDGGSSRLLGCTEQCCSPGALPGATLG